MLSFETFRENQERKERREIADRWVLLDPVDLKDPKEILEIEALTYS